LLLDLTKANWYKFAGNFLGHNRVVVAYNINVIITYEEESVNKSELVDAVAESADITKAAASRAVDGMVEAITSALKSGDQVSLIGFGTFLTRDRAARSGRNPRTGETIEIKAAKTPAFKAGKALKDAVN